MYFSRVTLIKRSQMTLAFKVQYPSWKIWIQSVQKKHRIKYMASKVCLNKSCLSSIFLNWKQYYQRLKNFRKGQIVKFNQYSLRKSNKRRFQFTYKKLRKLRNQLFLKKIKIKKKLFPLLFASTALIESIHSCKIRMISALS